MHDYSVEIHRKAFPAEQTHGKRKAEAFRSRLHSRPTVNTLRWDLAICRLDVVHREYAGRFRYDGIPCPHLQNVVRDAVGERNDEWAVQRARYLTLETISQMSDDPIISLPAVARRSSRPKPGGTATAGSYTTSWDTIHAIPLGSKRNALFF